MSKVPGKEVQTSLGKFLATRKIQTLQQFPDLIPLKNGESGYFKDTWTISDYQTGAQCFDIWAKTAKSAVEKFEKCLTANAREKYPEYLKKIIEKEGIANI